MNGNARQKGGSGGQSGAEHDPFHLTIHTLSNGLTVYLSCQNHKPRIETRIVIRAGAAQDPPDSTGAAHLLEHLMFKGSRSIGALDDDAEQRVLAEIADAFEELRTVKDEQLRSAGFRRIDALNQKASTLSLAGEYDRILSHIGARGVNAFTGINDTVYKCDIPTEELSRWVSLEAERFSAPVIRSFLTEIEAVFEEFNQDQDDDFSRARDLLLARLFPDHPYGNHSILGTREHIKAPSLKKIDEFRRTWYRPEHMAICLAGEFDRKEALALIEESWGRWTPEPVLRAGRLPGPAGRYRSGERRSLKGADSEFTMTGFRFGGVRSEDYVPLTMLDLILSNSQAGLIDLNLVQKQKILEGGSSLSFVGDYSWFVLYGTPGPRQSLGSVHRLLSKQLDLIRRGDFDRRLLDGVIKFLEIEQTQDLESNQIVNAFAECFSDGISWAEYLGRLDRLRAFSAEDLIRFVREKFHGNHVRVDKREGEDPSLEMVEKPEITPLKIDYDRQSEYFRRLRSDNPGCPEPVFSDYDSLLDHRALGNQRELSCCRNRKNDLFELSYIFPEGKSSSLWLPIAGDFFPYMGAGEMKPEAIQKEAFLLGLDLSFQVDLDRTVFSVYGKEEDLARGLNFVQKLIRTARGSGQSYRKYVLGLLKRRRDAKLSKKLLLSGGLYSWGLFGENSPFRDILSEKELRAGSAEMLTAELQRLFDLPHRIFYYGSRSPEEAAALIEDTHPGRGRTASVRERRIYTELEGEGKVLFAHHDMMQAEIYRLAPQRIFEPSQLAGIHLFNEFFGAGLNSLFFQEIREARGLAYTAYSSISIPEFPDQRHILSSYLGTQADKLPDALAEMDRLFLSAPAKNRLFEEARTALLKSRASDRFTDSDLFWSWWEARELGLEPGFREQVFRDLESYTPAGMENFFKESVIPVKSNVLVLGSRDDLDMKTLEKRGEFREFSPEELFNY